jgi:predicted GNAT superfamily acetyltransferase
MFTIRLLETPEEMSLLEEMQRVVWGGSETDVVPLHMLITAVHNGGLALGAFDGEKMIGFVFGFPGLETTPDGPRPKHCSHMMGIHPNQRDSGVGFALKRAQWQLTRRQGLDHVTWTYDPLLSRNAYLNIAKLGAVCLTYRRSEYGDMRDELNVGLPSDRFQVDWWIHTRRVETRLAKRPRPTLKLIDATQAGLLPCYPLRGGAPPERLPPFDSRMILAEIPADFNALKSEDFALARDWRFFTRELFETAFAENYIVTDFIFEAGGGHPRGFYILTHGEATLDTFGES